MVSSAKIEGAGLVERTGEETALGQQRGLGDGFRFGEEE